LARYSLQMAEVSDMFGVEGRLRLGKRLAELPEHTRQSVELELVTLDFLEVQLADIEKRLEALMKVTAEADLLKTLPYVGRILSRRWRSARWSGLPRLRIWPAMPAWYRGYTRAVDIPGWGRSAGM